MDTRTRHRSESSWVLLWSCLRVQHATFPFVALSLSSPFFPFFLCIFSLLHHLPSLSPHLPSFPPHLSPQLLPFSPSSLPSFPLSLSSSPSSPFPYIEPSLNLHSPPSILPRFIPPWISFSLSYSFYSLPYPPSFISPSPTFPSINLSTLTFYHSPFIPDSIHFPFLKLQPEKWL